MVMDEIENTIRSYRVSGSNRDLFLDSSNRLWIGTSGGLMLHPLEKNSEPLTFRLPPRHGDSRNFIQAIAEDSQGFIWFGSQLKGLARLDPETQSVTQYNPETKDGFPTFSVEDMVIGPDNLLWIATDVGLVRFDPVSFDYTVYDSRHGLLFDQVSSLVFAPDGNLWITTNCSVAHFDRESETFRIYGSEYGFRNRSYYGRNKFCDEDGTLYFGGKDGIEFFNPSKLRINTSQPRPTLAGFQVDGNDITQLARTGNIVPMTYRNDLLEIEIAAPYYTNQDMVRYEYKVDGIHKDWVNINYQRNVVFSNLGPGDYTFHARAISPHGVASDHELTVPFKVAPPFWSTWWFRALLLLIVLALVVMIVLYRERQIRRVQKKDSQLQKQIQELEKKALLAQMNPHFIFNSMNSIQQFMAVRDFEGAMKYLTKFSRLLRAVLNISSESRISLADEINLIEDYIELEQMRFPNKFNYSDDVDKDVAIHSLEIPPFFIQPQVENAIRHGLLHKNGNGQISIKIGRTNDKLSITVEDNGVGREVARKLKMSGRSRDKSMGLALVEERLKHLHAADDVHNLSITRP